MKKVLALVLAVVLAFGLASVAFADVANPDINGVAAACDKDGNPVDGATLVPGTDVYFFLLKDGANVSSVDASVAVTGGELVKVDGKGYAVKCAADKAAFTAVAPVEVKLEVVVTGKKDAVKDGKVSAKATVKYYDGAVEAAVIDNADWVGDIMVFDKNAAADAKVTVYVDGNTLTVQPKLQDKVRFGFASKADDKLIAADIENNFVFLQVTGGAKFIRDAVLTLNGCPKDYVVYSVSVEDGKNVYTKIGTVGKDGKFAITGKSFGSYVFAQKALAASEEAPANPDTGANNVVGVAAVFAVVSLAAAGAVAFKKASK